MKMRKNARSAPLRREEMARGVLAGETGEAAASFGVTAKTAPKWAGRFQALGPAGMADRSSRPRRLRRPTPGHVAGRTVSLRRRRLAGHGRPGPQGRRRVPEGVHGPLRAPRGRRPKGTADNGPCHASRAFAAACKDLGVRHVRTKPCTPRTDGKAGRFIQMALAEMGLRPDLREVRIGPLPTFRRVCACMTGTGSTPHWA